MSWKFDNPEPAPPPRRGFEVPPHVVIARGIEEVSRQIEAIQQQIEELLDEIRTLKS